MSRKNLNLFGTYLRPNRTRRGYQRPEQALLDILSSHRGPIGYRDLWASAYRAGLDQDGFVGSLRDLKRKRVITISPRREEADNPVVALVQPVRTVATLLRNG